MDKLVTKDNAALAGAATIGVFLALNATSKYGKLVQGIAAGVGAFVGIAAVKHFS